MTAIRCYDCGADCAEKFAWIEFTNARGMHGYKLVCKTCAREAEQ